jgi:hypothetical protein
VAPPDEPDALPLADPEVLGDALGLEPAPLLDAPVLVLGELLAPPEAVSDFFEASLGADPDGAGVDGLDEAPPEAEPEAVPPAPEGDDGELLGEEDVLELDEPGLDALLLLESPPLSHAARPKARATAPAIRESFMCPPWLGKDTRASCEPSPTP